ncbi:MAG: hypothetical protein A2821_03125 [Candidatus Magasanikbacteria bacterium RIFCSPHIGHO2_01_FULL_41_23]|nr:MAG: hypothetical protein A2821_03125 [Candidatus Magasanikbacteria bacterium RIFCSPHIGHO2_01_FULL_41_23]OGH67330.1 MAG: hypothetical protein A3C66_01140 [Candidatus Magasanikbacteria bacterium RIFCSPHIGHO2_02_FULL_41_35]OGH76555.1 MAG: hypothetical protein A3F22_00350 [Candidatus Magasanikbacteria bacterium RIFCSPHIGHO2_12_FULL_41_16]
MEKCIFVGGKQIGANCLRLLVEHGVRPEIVIPNLDDTGEDTWYESLMKIATTLDLPLIRDTKVRDETIVKKIQDIQPDIIFCIGGMQIIPPEVLAVPRLGTLNIHPALLPKYRGRFSTAHAIFNGETHTGVTIHWMDAGIDSGPIIKQEQFEITSDDTGRSVYDKFTATGTKLFADFLETWLTGKEIVVVPQDESQATYYPKGLPGDGEIDWSWNGEQIRNWIRAMTFAPFPPPSFNLGDKKFIIYEKK